MSQVENSLSNLEGVLKSFDFDLELSSGGDFRRSGIEATIGSCGLVSECPQNGYDLIALYGVLSKLF